MIVATFKDNKEKAIVMRIVSPKDGQVQIFKTMIRELLNGISLAMQWMGFQFMPLLLCQLKTSWIIATENSISMRKPKNINMLITLQRIKHMPFGHTR